MNKTELIKQLISLGARPKYIAFSYLVFILQNYEIEEISLMDKITICTIIAKRFSISPSIAERNLGTIIRSFYYGLSDSNLLSRAMPTLAKNEQPTIKEFLIIIACSLDNGNN